MGRVDEPGFPGSDRDTADEGTSPHAVVDLARVRSVRRPGWVAPPGPADGPAPGPPPDEGVDRRLPRPVRAGLWEPPIHWRFLTGDREPSE